MNEVLLIYIYGIWDNLYLLTKLGAFFTTLSLLLLVFIALINSNDKGTKVSDEPNFSLAMKFNWPAIIFMTVYTLMPSKNILVLMVAAPTIVQIANDAADSNRTKSIVNILDNSINYLEKKSKELE